MEVPICAEGANGDSQNNFASVWVKVEIADEEPAAEEMQIAVNPYDVEVEFDQKPSSPPQEPNKKRTRNKKAVVEPELKPEKQKKMRTRKNNKTELTPDTTIITIQSKNRIRNYKLLKCEHCDYTTLYGNSLKMHLLNHTGEKPFKCDLCSYKTKTLTTLERHKIIHKKESGQPIELYKCEFCPYETCYKSDLSIHKNKHTKAKKYKCDKCSFVTLYRHSINKHKISHNDKDCYKCDKCTFTTKYEGYIIRHLTQVHREYAESIKKCEYCDFATLTKWRLNKHLISSKRDHTLQCIFCDYQTVYHCQFRCHRSTHLKKSKDSITTESSSTNNLCESYDDTKVKVEDQDEEMS